MALISYDKNINDISIQESMGILILINEYINNNIIHPDNMKEVIMPFFNACSNDPKKYKKFISKYHNTKKDKLYNFIKDKTKSNHNSILLIKSTICRIYDWFLLSDKELEAEKGNSIPPVLDRNIQVFKNYDHKDDFLLQHNLNRDHINDFLGYDSDLNIVELMNKTDNAFTNLLHSEISDFRGRISKLIGKGIYKRTTNKSAHFYNTNIETNSYVENLFKYDSDLGYMKYIKQVHDNYDFVRIEGDNDFIRYNMIKNKGMGTRFVFHTNSQINSFLNPLNHAFEKSFSRCRYMGTYNQDKAIEDMYNIFSSNINKDISILCLDASKYSDTLPISLIKHVLDLLFGNEVLVSAICECLNIPVYYKDELVDHNATLQGIYFDFSAITLVNLYIQIAISEYIERRLIMTNVVGDDAYTIVSGLDHEIYGDKGREVYAHFGCKVNEDKVLTANSKEGFITYLKYTGEVDDGVITNISGISPGLVFKNIHSYSRLGAIIAYLKKSLYIPREDIPKNLLLKYHEVFSDIIYSAQVSKIMRLSREDASYIRDNAVDLMLDRPFLFGGYKNYDMNLKSDRESIIKEIESSMRYIEYNFMDDNNRSVLDEIEYIKEVEDLKVTVLDKDIKLFITEEISNMYIKLSEFRDKGKSYIEYSEGDVRDIRDILRNITDRKFQRYIPGGLTTDRVTQQPFEDKLLLADIEKPIDISMSEFYPVPNDYDEKQIIYLLLSQDEGKIRYSRGYTGTRFIDISNDLIITFTGRTTGNYITVRDWIYRSRSDSVRNKDRWAEEFTIVANALVDTLGPDAYNIIIKDQSNVYKIISILQSRIKRGEDIIKNAVSVIEEIRQDIKDSVVSYYKEGIVSNILEDAIMKLRR